MQPEGVPSKELGRHFITRAVVVGERVPSRRFWAMLESRCARTSRLFLGKIYPEGVIFLARRRCGIGNPDLRRSALKVVHRAKPQHLRDLVERRARFVD